jgi:citrate synthase
MKFGHRVFATEDPRGTYQRVPSAGRAGTRGDETCFRMSRRTQEVANAQQCQYPGLDRGFAITSRRVTAR